MARQRKILQTGFKVYKHDKLTKVSQKDIHDQASKIFQDADKGIQTAILSVDGRAISSIVGLNGTRYLPDPSPDPLDEMLKAALAMAAEKKK